MQSAADPLDGLKEVNVYSVLSYQKSGPILRFTFTTAGIDEHAWHHTAIGHPIGEWFDTSLIPLASSEGQCLTDTKVVQCVTKRAQAELIPASAIDWLGLALLASQRYREVAAKIADSDSPDLQDECAAVSALVPILSDIAERFAQAIQAKLQEFPRNAA